MTTLAELDALVDVHPEGFFGIATVYELLLGGVPNINGLAYLIGNAADTNFGSNNPAVTFNQENVFINVANALVLENANAATAFGGMIEGQATLSEKVGALYAALVPDVIQTIDGVGYLTRPEALAFYEQAAAERGVAGPDGAALVAMGSILNVLLAIDWGVGDAVRDLRAAIDHGSATMPTTGSDLIPMEDADGVHFDNDAISFSTMTDAEYHAATSVNFA